MKKIICLILALTVSVGAFCFPVGALEEGDIFIEGDFRCKIVNGAVSIVKYLGEQGEDVDVVVPETIRGYTVKYIGAEAWGSAVVWDSPIYDPPYILRSINLPDTIEAVGSCAFGSGLYDGLIINLPKNLKYVDSMAFYGCKIPIDPEVNMLVLPEGIEYIGSEAFVIRDHLEGYTYDMIKVPESLIYMEYEALGLITVGGGDDIVLCGPAGAYAEEYCQNNLRHTYVVEGYCIGDIDHNGVINVADIMTLKSDIMRDTFRDAELSDLDNDGKITVSDMISLKDKIMNPKTATLDWIIDVGRLFGAMVHYK